MSSGTRNNFGPGYGAAHCAPAAPPAAQPPQSPALQLINSGVEEAISRLVNIVQRVDNYGQYLFGPIPEQANPSPCAPKPSGAVLSIQDNVQLLHHVISLVNDKLDRIGQL